jgi:hypothetical protein
MLPRSQAIDTHHVVNDDYPSHRNAILPFGASPQTTGANDSPVVALRLVETDAMTIAPVALSRWRPRPKRGRLTPPEQVSDLTARISTPPETS